MGINYKPAKTIREFRELMEADPKTVNLIRNKKDWREYTRTRAEINHPLKSLTDEEMHEFDKSLKFGKKFGNGGIASANVGVLQRKLTFIQYEEVLGALGMDTVLAADFEGYWCDGRASCKKMKDYICIGDNCGDNIIEPL